MLFPAACCVSRELGSNIPRGKIFKMYRGNTEQSLRCRSKIDDIPEGYVASGSSGPFKALSPVHPPPPMHAVARGHSEDNNNNSCCLPMIDMGADTALDPPRCSSSTECASSLLNMDEAESASSDELGVTSDESNPSSGDAKGDAPRDNSISSNSISSNSSNNYFIGPNEPVFIGAKRYSEHFIFWQVIYLCSVI